MSGNNKWSETVILVDADYADRVAFDLIVNFERMLERRIPAADLPRWLDCLALDGGVRPADEGKGEIQAIFLHAKERLALENFMPAHFERDLNGQAFRDNLGEFALASFAVEDIVSPADFYVQSLEALLGASGVKRLILVPDEEAYGERVRRSLAGASEGKEVTLLTMTPHPARGYTEELLGYSLMNALGIRASELGGSDR